MKKVCFVPICLNSSETSPHKCFIFVPRNPTRRKSWFEAVGLEVVKTVKYCCEDHFNLKEDSIDFSYYKIRRKPPRIKSGIVPHLFLNACNVNIDFSQLEETQSEKSSDSENEVEINVSPLIKVETESENEEFGLFWTEIKVENINE